MKPMNKRMFKLPIFVCPRSLIIGILTSASLSILLSSCITVQDHKTDLYVPAKEQNQKYGVQAALLVPIDESSYVFEGGPTTFTSIAFTLRHNIGSQVEKIGFETINNNFPNLRIIRNQFEANSKTIIIIPKLEKFSWQGGFTELGSTVELSITVSAGKNVLFTKIYKQNATHPVVSAGVDYVAVPVRLATKNALRRIYLRSLGDILKDLSVVSKLQSLAPKVAENNKGVKPKNNNTTRLPEPKQEPKPKQVAKKSPQPTPEPRTSTSGSGFFVSKLGHVITNQHVVDNCKSVTVGDNAKKQVIADVLETDRRNDLALLKISSLKMASVETKSLIQKLGIKIVPLASDGLLRSEDVDLGEKVLVAGYPYGEMFSNSIKVTGGMVSANRGLGDDTGQFQMDAAVQPGNSGGPIYDENGNIVGVVVAQLNKMKFAKHSGSIPENVNFGIKASTVRQFLSSSGLPTKWSKRSESMSTRELAKIAKRQTVMVMCHR
jgi:S1-C subfamily serine protease